jgi:colanic acid/amylovoran biosynthesis glycosyltransferase
MPVLALTEGVAKQAVDAGQRAYDHGSTKGKNPLILQLMSTFPPLTETFVMREIRQLRTDGWNIVIGELRPMHKTPRAQGFEDLVPFVSPAQWFSLDLVAGIFFFLASRPLSVWRCLKTITKSVGQPRYFPKMFYILFSSMRLGFRFRNSHPSLVRTHFLRTEALAARFLGDLLRVPYSLTVYTVSDDYPHGVVKEIVRGAAFLVADTHQVREYLKSLGEDPGYDHVVHNSVSIDEFPERSAGGGSRPALVLAVGRLDHKKGFGVLLEACSALRQRGVAFHCVIIGDGTERDRLWKARQRLGLEECVDMLGSLSFSEVKQWYYKAGVLVMPSIVTADGQTDGMPTVVIEAMASGLAIVGTRTAGIPEAVKDELNGFLVSSNDAKELADRLGLLLAREDLRERFGSMSRRIAETEFSLARKGDALSNLLRQHLFSSPRPASLPCEEQII